MLDILYASTQFGFEGLRDLLGVFGNAGLELFSGSAAERLFSGSVAQGL